ncbi:MAG: peptidylprolyl isomerase [Planctomycetota bacterium]|nr:peptidylprolyl isomerase [Planctomycetota bacterium]MDA1141504.1 peptidylprolyl isomerase [Planctomycetota bacterium]
MSEFNEVVLGHVGDRSVTLGDLLVRIKATNNEGIIDQTVDAVVVRKCAEEMGISVSEEELQNAADEFRRKAGLVAATETNEWLESKGLTVDDFEKWMEDDLFRLKLRKEVCTEEKLRKLFTEHLLGFEKARIAVIVLDDEGVASELADQLEEGEAEFPVLAEKYSTHKETAQKSGYWGRVSRDALPGPVELAVFADDVPEIVGPVAAEEKFYLIRILEPKKADLDDPVTRKTCTDLVFEDFLKEKATGFGIKLSV